jgi:hypothetical protein
MRVAALSSLLICVGSLPLAAEDALDPHAVVERGLKATGARSHDRPVAMTWKDKGVFFGGGSSVPYTGEWAFQAPDLYRFEITGECQGMKAQLLAVVHGHQAWESGFGKTREMTGEKLEQMVAEVYQFHVLTLAPLLEGNEYKLSFAEDKEVHGKMATGIRVEHAQRPMIILYFDKESGLLVKDEMVVKDIYQGWKDALDEIYFEDYKEVDGRKRFTKMHATRNGAPMADATLFDHKTAEKLDPKLFEKP